MVRFILVAVAACWVAAPAQAALLPVDLQGAANAQQAPAAAVTTARDTTAQVTSAARRVVREVRSSATAASAASAPAAEPTARAATGLAEAAVDTVARTSAAAPPVQADGPHAGASPGRGGEAVARGELTHSGQGNSGQGKSARERPGDAVRRGDAVRLGRGDRSRAPGPLAAALPAPLAAALPGAGPAHPESTAGPVAGSPRGTPASRPQTRPPTPHPGPSPSGGAAAAPGAGSVAFAGLALLAAAVCLVGPRLRRRLLIRPPAWRSAAFVSLLERPG